MKKKIIIICVLIASGLWFATMPHGGVASVSKFVIGGNKQPFKNSDQNPQPPAKADVSLAIVRTAAVSVPEALAFSGGRLRRQSKIAFSAFIIRHGSRTVAFDLGLGTKIDKQYQSDMPYWARTSFRYEHPVVPLINQLPGDGSVKIDDVLLSHSHWDHASGLEDFPDATIWVSSSEFANLKNMARGAGSSWPSQVGRADIKWDILELTGGRYEGFDRSLDLFGDGTVVAVEMAGHTPGSLGLFVTVSSGQRFFLVGDAVWNAKAILLTEGKFLGASLFVDGDRAKTAAIVKMLARLIKNDPDLVIIPAHDGDLQESLGLFPKWLV